MKRKITILVMIITLFMITGCEVNKKEQTDGMKFKEEYTSLNGEKTESGKTIRSLTISDDNPFIYQTAEEIAEKIENKESFIVYFGFPKCPWCRSVLEELIKAAKDNEVETIYYVDVLDIRDTKEIQEDGSAVTTKEGTEGYNKLLEQIGNVLEEYMIEDTSAGEKRIYAPNIVAVSKGKAIQMETGISDELTDPYDKLTEEVKKYAYNKFDCLMECLEEESTTCQKNMC